MAASVRPAKQTDFVDRVIADWKTQDGGLDLRAHGLVERILRLAQAVEKEAEELCEGHGISHWCLQVLMALRRVGPPYRLTPTSLYRCGMVTSGGMTKRLIQLEAQGLIDRVPVPSDRRSVYVQLTRKGKRIVDAVAPEYVALQARVVGDLSRAEKGELEGVLRRMLLALHDE